MTDAAHVLAINCGSSSLKVALFAGERALHRAEVGDIGGAGPGDHAEAARRALDDLHARGLPAPDAVAHRLVHGGPSLLAPTRLDDAVLATLKGAIPFAPLHLPAELRAIEAVRERLGDVPQIVSFDTSFHRTMPMVAQRFALPRALFEAGVRRYGFHGLSCEYVVETLGARTLGRAVVAHLGSGASMTAVEHGESVETTMGLTPTGGLVMGTRVGDLDPGLSVYLLEHGHDARSLEKLFNHEAGLLALSETTPRMEKLLAAEATDPRAALAVDAFCHHARRHLGSLAAVLGGLDSIVFTGGIGAHGAEIRRRICARLAYLGVVLDMEKNAAGAAVVSQAEGRCVVHVIETDEERMLARHARRTLGWGG